MTYANKKNSTATHTRLVNCLKENPTYEVTQPWKKLYDCAPQCGQNQNRVFQIHTKRLEV